MYFDPVPEESNQQIYTRVLMSDCEQFAQIAQDQWATVSDLLRFLRTDEWLWTNRSGRSWQKSNREGIAQVAQDNDKRKTLSNSLMIKEQMSESLIIFLANHSFALWLTKNKRFAQKNVNTIVFFVRFLKNKRFAHSLFFKELCEQIGCTWKKSDCEQISQVTHQKWATVSDMNRLLTKNERISKSLVFFMSESIIRSFFWKIERFV